MRQRFQQARRAEELPRETNLDDYTRYVSMMLAGLSIQAVNGATGPELRRLAKMSIQRLGY